MGKGIKNIQFSFGESNLTHFGGLFLIHSFCKKLRLKQTLQLHVKLHQRNQEYQTAEFVLLLLYIIILGIARIENIRYLQTNGVFKKIIGIKKLPHPTAIRRFLHRLTPATIRQIVEVHNLIQKKIFLILHPKTSITFDIDGTVLTVYGKQQKAKIGFNPKRKGARSYSRHPMFRIKQRILVWESETRQCFPGKSCQTYHQRVFGKIALSHLPNSYSC